MIPFLVVGSCPLPSEHLVAFSLLALDEGSSNPIMQENPIPPIADISDRYLILFFYSVRTPNGCATGIAHSLASGRFKTRNCRKTRGPKTNSPT